MLRTLLLQSVVSVLPGFLFAPLIARGDITSPLDIPGHVLWLDGDDLDGDGNVDAAVTGTAVNNWADKSSGLGATGATRANGAPVRAAAVRAGHHAVKFTGGSQDKLDIPSLSLSSGYTAVVMAQAGSFAGSGHLLSGLDGAGTDAVLYRTGAGSCRFYSGVPTGGTDLPLGTMPANTWTMAGVQIAPAGQDYALLQSLRSPLEWNGTAALQGVRIGNLDRDTPSNVNRAEAWDGHIAEVILYNRVLTATEVTDLTRWLNAKYALGIAWPTGAMTTAETGNVSGGVPSTLLNTSEPVVTGRVNAALAVLGGTAFAQDFIGPADPRNFRPLRANDGLYADAPEGAPPVQEPWIAATLSSFLGVRFSGPVTLDRIGFEDQFANRRNGQVIVEYTRDDLSAVPVNANLGLDPATINSKAWLLLDVLTIADATDTRHLYAFEPLTGVTGIRLRINSSASEFAVAELEAWASSVVPAGGGPGTVGTTDGNSDLELWVKADGLGLADAAAVTSWPEASGNARTLTPLSAAAQPLLAANALGGLPAVRFTADNLGRQSLPSTANEFTMIAVIKPDNTGAYHNVLDGAGGVRPMLWMDGMANYEFNFNTGAVASRGGGYDVLVAVKRNAGSGISRIHLNGPAVAASGPNNFNIPASADYDFFSRNGGQSFSGDVAELIVYSTALTQPEIARVGRYLQQKYSLPVTFPPDGPFLAGYAGAPAVLHINVPAGPFDATIQGGTATSFSITPALPSGLTFSTTTGRIAGTPAALSPAADYTITATFTGGATSSATISLAVLPPALAGYSRSPATFTRGRLAVPVVPIVIGAPLSGFSVSPPLPSGLELDPVSGVISGTPANASPTAPYAIKASFTGFPDSIIILTIEVLEPAWTLDITEVMAANDSTLADGDGNYSDWVELHNFGTAAIDLSGWSLTDSSNNLRKYVLPPHRMEPGSYLVVFASGDEPVDASGNLHTGFAISASGEYLALVRPDGVIVREFAPELPAVPVDDSYGTPDRITYGTYATPTPGTANGFFTSVSAAITATPPAKTFAGTLSVTLSAPLPAGGVIRYTTNGTAPTSASTAYSAALTFSVTTKLRARVFAPGLDPGPELRADYLKLGGDVSGFSSNLPLLFIHTDGAIAGASATTLTGAGSLFIPADVTGRAAATGTPDHAGRTGLRLRGRSSLSFPQKQYKLETYDTSEREVNVPLLGMPSASDWVLYAPYTDKSLMRNAITYLMWGRMGWPTLNWRFVEVFINDDNDTQFSYADDYAGVYLLVESPDLDRIGLEGPQNSNDPGQITGGFMVETGASDDAEFNTFGSGRQVGHKHRDPGLNKLTAAQTGWIRAYVIDFEKALYGSGFVHPENGRSWRTYTDVASQVDYRIAREWARNFDGGSTYWHVPRGGQLTMGPLWDYNWALGNVNYAEGGDVPGYRTDGWNRSFTNFGTWAPWWLRMEQETDWWQEFIDRWADLREGPLAIAAVNAEIDAIAAMLGAEAAGRNFTKWPQLGQFTVISPPGWETRTTYQSEVNYMKTWLQQRSAWIDSQFPPRPAFSPLPGGVTAGTAVTLTTAAGQTIHYTFDGTDPRLPGGAVNPAALSVVSGGIVTINASTILTARAKNGTVWGAPEIGGYVTGTMPAASTLIVSEIQYHPANPTASELAADPLLDDDDFEFIELRNTGTTTLDLTGASFTEGVQFTVPAGTVLAAGAYLVVVKNLTAFTLRYGAGGTIAGQYTGNLDNDADTVVLLAASGAELIRLRYDDDWTSAADGAGYSLTLRDPAEPPADDSSPAAWALSGSPGGSPGAANGPVFTDDFHLWRLSTFSAADLADPARSGPLADPDGDNYDNLTEFALLSHPLIAGSSPQITGVLNGPNVEFTLTRPRQTFGLTWSIESSAQLTAWAPSATTTAMLSQTVAGETVRLSAPHGGSARQFWRIGVTLSGTP